MRTRTSVLWSCISAAAAALLALGLLSGCRLLAPRPSSSPAQASTTASTTQSSTPSATTSATCWDGSDPGTDGTCPAIAGEPGAKWAVPIFDDATCEKTANDSDKRIKGYWLCTWSNLPQTYAQVFEFTSPNDGRNYFDKIVKEKYPDASAEDLKLEDSKIVIGARWSGAGGTWRGDKWIDDALVYDRLPYGVYLATDTTLKGTQADQDSALNDRILLKPAEALAMAG